MDERIARPEGQSATSGNAVGQMPMSVMESLNRGKDAIGDAAAETMRAAASDLQMLRNDLNSLKDTLSRFMVEASTEAMNRPAQRRQRRSSKPARRRAASLTKAPRWFPRRADRSRHSAASSRAWCAGIRSVPSPARSPSASWSGPWGGEGDAAHGADFGRDGKPTGTNGK